jgi:hypothetical protein
MHAHKLYLLGIIILLLGCLLPWSYSHGFIGVPDYGITIPLKLGNVPGMIIVLLIIITIVIQRVEATILKNITMIISCLVISIIAIIQIINVELVNIEFGGVEPATIGIGTILLIIGSILLFISLIITKEEKRPTRACS